MATEGPGKAAGQAQSPCDQGIIVEISTHARLARGHSRKVINEFRPFNEAEVTRREEKARAAFRNGFRRKSAPTTLSKMAKALTPTFPARPEGCVWTKSSRSLRYRGDFSCAGLTIEQLESFETFQDDLSLLSYELFYSLSPYSGSDDDGTVNCAATAVIQLHLLQRVVERCHIGAEGVKPESIELAERLSSFGRTIHLLDALCNQKGSYMLPWRGGAIVCRFTHISREGWKRRMCLVGTTFLSEDMLQQEHRRRITPLWDAPWDIDKTKKPGWTKEEWQRATEASFLPAPGL